MGKINVQVNTSKDISFLANYATQHGFNGYVEGNHSIVSISSILGWFSLDLTKPQTIISESPAKEIEKFSAALEENGIKYEVMPA